jgi:ABC-type polar amino acid transport system ATPase subunit
MSISPTASTHVGPQVDASPILLSARDVRKSFGGRDVLHGVSLEVVRGERVCLIGRSGSGKSTFLRCLNLLEPPTEGEIYVAGVSSCRWSNGLAQEAPKGRQLARHRALVGMVFQHFELFPHLTALGNVALGPRHVLGRNREVAEQEARALLERVGLHQELNSFPATLSGGQRQRVAIARALAMEPKLLLFDEPTSSLDPELALEVLMVMKELAAAGTTMIVVTHEIRFAREVATKIAMFEQGRIIEEGLPEQVLGSPRDDRTRHFLRSVLADLPPVAPTAGGLARQASR